MELMATVRLTGAPLVQVFDSITRTKAFTIPVAPQLTVIVFVLPPDACVPPVIDQVYVFGGLLVTTYDTPVDPVQTSARPVMAYVTGGEESVVSPNAYWEDNVVNADLLATLPTGLRGLPSTIQSLVAFF